MGITPPPEQDKYKSKILGFESSDRLNKSNKYSEFVWCTSSSDNNWCGYTR